jgi:hypothetical protein
VLRLQPTKQLPRSQYKQPRRSQRHGSELLADCHREDQSHVSIPGSPAFFRAQSLRYFEIVRLANITGVLPYDATEKKAGLVPESEVILHMIQYRLFQDPAVVSG